MSFKFADGMVTLEEKLGAEYETMFESQFRDLIFNEDISDDLRERRAQVGKLRQIISQINDLDPRFYTERIGILKKRDLH